MGLCSCGYALAPSFKFCPECGCQVSARSCEGGSTKPMAQESITNAMDETLQLRIACGLAIVEKYIGFNEPSVVISGSHNGIPVDGIGAKAFVKCEHLEHVVIEEGVRMIGDGAFSSCSKLRTVILPTSLRLIGNEAFANCRRLEVIYIPDGVISLGNATFSKCTLLSDVILPEGLCNLPDQLFYDCNSLTVVTVPKRVRRIGELAFAGCTRLKQLSLPAGLLAIRTKAFQDCHALESIHVPKSTLWFGEMVFSQATFIRPDLRYNGWYQYSPLSRLTIICSPGAPVQAYARSHEIKLTRFAGIEPEEIEPIDYIYKVILVVKRGFGQSIDVPSRIDTLRPILGAILPAKAYLDQIVEERESRSYSSFNNFHLDLNLSLSGEEAEALRERLASSGVECYFKRISE